MQRLAPPFYGNRQDNTSCSLAVYRSLIEHFTGEPVSWAEVERLQGFKPGKAAWTIKALVELASNGWDIVVYEPFDYDKYLKLGKRYLYDQFGKEIADWQIKNSNIEELAGQIPAFLKTIKHHTQNPAVKDIERMIDENRLVSLVLNSRTLNGRSGYVSHAVLVFDYDEEHFKFHDPGLPPKKSRIEKKSLVIKAMGDAADATGFTFKG